MGFSLSSGYNKPDNIHGVLSPHRRQQVNPFPAIGTCSQWCSFLSRTVSKRGKSYKKMFILRTLLQMKMHEKSEFLQEIHNYGSGLLDQWEALCQRRGVTYGLHLRAENGLNVTRTLSSQWAVSFVSRDKVGRGIKVDSQRRVFTTLIKPPSRLRRVFHRKLYDYHSERPMESWFVRV